MKRIINYDPSLGTFNIGDEIISKSIYDEMNFLYDNSYIVRYSTHTPISKAYQNIYKGPVYMLLNSSDYKFLLGTNIIKYNLFTGHPDFNINYNDIRFYKDTICVGVGTDVNSKKMNAYTKNLYKHILNKKYYHSTRDERTKKLLESLGLKAINTGCPTLWSITDDICENIPTKKSNICVFTLTCYDKNKICDQQLIDILNNTYKKVYFFPQGVDDYDYLLSLNNIGKIIVLKPNLRAFDKILKNDIDYVGTRLHAGIYSLKHKKRSIIISIDNRASDMKINNNLVCVSRDKIVDDLEKLIKSNFNTNIIVNRDGIDEWKKQFNE